MVGRGLQTSWCGKIYRRTNGVGRTAHRWWAQTAPGLGNEQMKLWKGMAATPDAPIPTVAAKYMVPKTNDFSSPGTCSVERIEFIQLIFFSGPQHIVVDERLFVALLGSFAGFSVSLRLLLRWCAEQCWRKTSRRSIPRTGRRRRRSKSMACRGKPLPSTGSPRSKTGQRVERVQGWWKPLTSLAIHLKERQGPDVIDSDDVGHWTGDEHAQSVVELKPAVLTRRVDEYAVELDQFGLRSATVLLEAENRSEFFLFFF